MKLIKTILWIILGLLIVTIAGILFGLPLVFISDKIFSFFPFLSSPASGDILLGIFIGMLIIGFVIIKNNKRKLKE